MYHNIGNLVVAVTVVTFVFCGRALLEAIDKSLQNHKHLQQQTPSTAGGGQSAKCGVGASNQTLLEARLKVKTVVLVETVLTLSSSLFSFVVMIYGLDLGMPLATFGVTFTCMCLMWLACNIHVHGGRSASYGRLASPMTSGQRSTLFPRSPLNGQGKSKLFSKQEEQQVVPTEAPPC